VRRAFAVALAAVVAMLTTTPSAWADVELTASSPAAGAELAAAPEKIALTFSVPIDPDLAVIWVSCGSTTWRVGAITANGSTLNMPVTPTGPTGRCRVQFNVITDDEEALQGEVGFTLRGPVAGTRPAPQAAAPTPAPNSDPITGGDLPYWVKVLLGVLALGMLAAGTVVLRRGRRPPGGW
jgi:hypothetical protein